MDALVDLLPLLFVGAYYLLSARRKAARRTASRPSAPAPGRDPSSPTPFQSFLSQLEEAMAEAAGATSPDVPGTRPDADLAIQKKPASDEFQPAEGSFDGKSAVDHERHGFGPENPLSEEVFERAPAFQEPTPAASRAFDPHQLQRPPATPGLAGWRLRLADPKAAQDAYVLQTVFGPRGGHRAEHRRSA